MHSFGFVLITPPVLENIALSHLIVPLSRTISRAYLVL